MEPDPWAYEKKVNGNGFSRIAGVDEVGRGPLAGPVVSAAVILPYGFNISGIRDSKKLTPAKRHILYEKIYDCARAVGIGIVDVLEIDRINILKASLLSMVIAVKNLKPGPDFLLVDGKFSIAVDCAQQPIISGDSLSISIGAASIIAKVSRDRIMERYHAEYPVYGFDRHKGYGTKAHREAIINFGCCPIHRKTFNGVKEHL
jgi:ribonuclease HII